MFLNSLKQNYFHTAIPELPMGKYAHLVVLRETTSFPLFQTDGELNTAYVKAGLEPQHQETRARITMFKRKQTSAERLHGRELLRRYGVITADKAEVVAKSAVPSMPYPCEYNSADFCKVCPDCIYYGFAIGTSGSERAKVLSDSAFSLTPFDVSHQSMTFNAPFENGTMSRGGETRSSIGEQDHILPQVFFPSVITIKDPTEAEFIYVLNNILRTSRYGAQTTRTGTVENHITAIVFSDGEIFSNLQLTQAIYDMLSPEQRAKTPLPQAAVLDAMETAVQTLLGEDGLVAQLYSGERLNALLHEIAQIASDEARLTAVLQQANAEANRYAQVYGVGAKEAKAKK